MIWGILFEGNVFERPKWMKGVMHVQGGGNVWMGCRRFAENGSSSNCMNWRQIYSFLCGQD